MHTKTNRLYLVFMFFGALVLLFIVAPLTGIFLETSGTEFFETAKDKEVRSSIILTLTTSLFGTLAFSIAAIPLAYLMAKKEFFGKKIVQGIIDLPIVIPHSAAGIAILGFISRDSALGTVADNFGLNLIGHPIGISLAMAFVSVPFLLNAARNGFEAVPDRLEKAALNLGASPTRVFFSISLPLAWRSIVSGFVLMFARGMSEFGAVVIIAYHPMITPVMIFERFNAFGLEYAQPIAAVFICVSLLFFIAIRLLSEKKQN
ncbi:MAG: ABC transporter permease [Bacteroidales bacterium]|nr:ABC transporter permease [Bacteroidales bacterium]